MNDMTVAHLQREILQRRLQRQMNARAAQAVAPLPMADRSQPLALSPAQQRLWLVAQMDGGASAAYHLPAGLRLRGTLDRAALRAALDGLVQRHEGLRTRFVERDGRPVQVIDDADTGFALIDDDLRAIGADAREAHATAIAAQEAAQPFDLADGPLVRGRLLQLAEDDHLLLITQHHIVSDGWSLGVLVRELGALYAAARAGVADALPPLALQYADYAAGQVDGAMSPSQDQQVAFWRDALAGAPALLELPTDRPRAPQRSQAGAQHRFTLRPELAAGLRTLSHNHGGTLFMALLAGWSTLLARLSNQSEIVVGTPVANRPRKELEGLIGFFVNTLALRVAVDGSLTVRQLLDQVRERTVAAYDHQSLPFDQVVDLAQQPRSTAWTPLFQTLLSIDNTPARVLQLPGLAIEPQDTATPHTQFDMNLVFSEDAEGLHGHLSYATALFDASTIERLVAQLDTVLAAMVATPDASVGSLPLMPAAQHADVLAFGDARLFDLSVDTIPAAFALQAARRPDAVAVIADDATLTYRQLDERANRLAHALRALGAGPDDRIAVCMDRGADMIVSLLAVLKAGAGYVPLDPSYPADRLVFMLQDCAPRAVIAHAAQQSLIAGGNAPVIVLDDAATRAAIEAQPATAPLVGDLLPNHLAYVIYTSGSTGQPKGVMIEHAHVSRLLTACDPWFHFDEHDTWTMFHSFAFDFSVWEIWGALLHGGKLAVVPYLTSRSPADFHRYVCEHGVTVLNQTPSAFQQFIAAQGDDSPAHQLRVVIFGGEALEPRTLQPWYRRPVNAATQLVNMYGITETTVHVTYHALTAAQAETEGASPIGGAIPDLSLRILDAQNAPVPVGVTGEMYVGGAGVARGYLNRPELSAQRFIVDPFTPGARLYRTGDLARWRADGTIEYLGRNDFQVKIRGFRIELGEIEARLAECAGVRDVVVIAREDRPGDKRLVAYLVPRAGTALTAAGLRAEIGDRLAPHMIPSAFVVLDSLPLTVNGKLDRKALPAPADDAFAAAAEHVAPRDATETTLCAIWAEVLERDRVGIHDVFFDIGGDSIRSIAIVAKAREVGLSIAIVDIFQTPTVAGLAAAIAGRTVEQAHDDVDLLAPADRALLPADVEQAAPMTLLQSGMVYHNAAEQDAGLYHDVTTHALGLPAWDAAVMRQVLDALTRRHPVLRTAFDLTRYSEPLQLVLRDAQVPLVIEDISALDGAAQDALIAAFVDAERKTAFDLARAPLLRLFVHVRGPGRIQSTLSFHHAMLDGWSLASLQTELFNEYLRALAAPSEVIALPALAVAPHVAVTRERAALGSAAHRAFWADHLAGHVFSAIPPADRDDTVDRCRKARVDDAVAQRLQVLAAELAVPMRTLLLAAHMRLLATLTGHDDVTTGVVSNTRPESHDGDKVLGLFLNTLPLRQPLRASSWRELVRETHRRELGLMSHRDFPYFQLFLDNGRQPLYEVMFNYINFHVYGQLGDAVQVEAYQHMFEATSHALEIDCSFSAEHGIRVEVDARELSGAQVERILAWYLSILGAIAANPDAAHEAHDPLDDAERALVRAGFDGESLPRSDDALIHQRFEAQARRAPHAVALAADGITVSYAELDACANRVAHRLQAAGVGPESRVALLTERGVDMIVAMLGILKAGGAYVPLDPAHPDERLAYMLADCRPQAVLVQPSLAGRLPALDTPALTLEHATFAGLPTTALPVAVDESNLAYVLYTSGSTGRPKGVMVEHRNVRHLVLHHTHLCELTPADRVLQFASFGFDNSIAEIFPALGIGARLVLRPIDMVVPDEQFAAFLVRHGVTMTDLPTAFWHLWAAEVRQGRCLPGPALRVVLAGGEKAEGRHLQAWSEATAGRAGMRWINTYGPTEATVNATTWTFNAGDALPAGDPPIGRPIANTHARIVDRLGLLAPVGVPGEILLGGDGVARGYLERPELTAERFVADRFGAAPGARLYRTGDLGRWRADGTIEYLGRNDFQVKIRGFRIELGEIELQLTRCDGVRESIVLAREDQPGDKRLVAYVVAEAGRTLDVAALREQLGRELADFMIPEAIVQLAAFPLNTSGKIDRHALPVPDASARAARAYEAPRGAVEQAIAQAWQQLFNLERVGRDDHFFQLGGHSLMVVGMMELLRASGLAADVRMVFAAPVLSDLATRIAETAKGSDAVADVPASAIPAGATAITPAMLPLVALAQDEIDAIVARIPGGAANVQDIYPLAPLQKGMLFHHLMEAEGDPYVLRMSLSFDGRARLDRFLGALQSVIDRHDVLRTAIVWEGRDEPVQVVCRQAALPVREWQGQGQGDTLAQLLAAVDPRTQRLDLQRAPLYAATIAADSRDDRWHLVLLHHHIVSDHVTLELIVEEVRAFMAGEADVLPASAPYRDFVAHTLRTDADAQREYFVRRLGDVAETTSPFDQADVFGNGAGVREAELDIDLALARRVRGAARARGLSPATLFHAAWARVLGATTGRDDVVFGTVLLGRLHGARDAGRAVGLFMNTLPVRVSLAGASVHEVVAATHAQLSELLSFEQTPLSVAQRCSGVAAGQPLFTSLLNYRHSQPSSGGAWEGVQSHDYEERLNYPVGMAVTDFGDAFQLSSQCVGVDPRRMADMLAQALVGVVEALEGEDRALQGVSVMGTRELGRVLVDFNATSVDVATGLVQSRFEALAVSQPDAVALVFGDARWSYGQLNARANQVAHRLLALGVQPDDRVAICMDRGLDMVAGLLGILKSGACYVPLDPGYPADRLAGMLEDSAPKALLVDATRPAWSAGASVDCFPVDGSLTGPVANPVSAAQPHHAAYVIYTSGSTGRPKGVVVEHRQVVNFLASMAREPGLSASDRLLAVTTIGFDIAGLELYLPLSEGAHIVIARRDEAADAQALAKLVEQHDITVMQATPATWRLLVASGWSGRQSLKVLCGGEALTAELSTQLQARVGEVWNVYGPTETTIWSTCRRCDGATVGVSESIGKPIANTQVYVLDARNEPVPLGVAGELWIAGDGVARGYLNRDELTAERFVADPFSDKPGARMYKTGDLCRWNADGTIAYLGRNDFQVKIRGFRIELGEIESQLVRCAGVREAAVVAREDRPGDKRLVAYVVGEGVQPEALREEIARHLSDVMIPTAWVVLDALPLTPNGKLDRKALPAPDASAALQQAYEAPQGQVEEAIAAVWQELLGVARVGRNDHFFELGGHSLTAVQFIARLRQSAGVEMGLRTLFERPTLAACAQAVAGANAKTETRIPHADRDAALPLSLAQQRLWFLDQLNPEAATAYHMPGALQLSGTLDLDALQRALDRVVARHESLRTSFESVDGAVLQRIAPADIGFALVHHDLGDLHGHEQRAAVQRHSLAEAAERFDLATGPLVRARLLRLRADEHVLLVTQHHIVSDGWSIGVLLGELRTLYAAFVQGQDDPLAPLQLQYADYAAWQRDWLQGDRLQSQVGFWREHLQGAPAVLELPTDRARPALPTHGAGRQAVALPQDLVQGLRELSQRHGATLFMTLLAGWGALLSRLGGQQDLVVGVPVANRSQAALEPLIGFFVNTLPLRLQPAAEADVAQWLGQVRATTLAAFDHQDVPFDQIVDAVQPRRSTSHAPLAQVLFSMNPARRAEDTEVGGTRIRGVECEPTTTSFDLVLDLQESDDGVAGNLTYATDLFDAATMARLAGQFVTLLRGMLQPSRTIARLPLLDAAQREQILECFNRVSEPLPDRRFLHQRFEAHAELHPEAIALLFEGEAMSYRQLDRRANQVAHRLLDLGVTTDDRIAVCLDRGFDLIVTLLGILKAGAAYVPLDPAYPADRLAFMLEDCAPRALVTQAAYVTRLAAPDVPCLRVDADAAQFALQPATAPDARRAAVVADQLAYMIYTSGSTGRPKGVMNTHGGLRNLVEGQSRWFAIGPRSRVLQFVSMSFDVAISDIAMTLSAGATLVMAAGNDLLPGEPLLSVMRGNRVTHAAFPIAVLAALPPDADLGPLEVLIAGGDAMPPALAEHWSSRYRMFNAYGPTEAAVCTALHLVQGPQGASVPIGRPLFGTRMFILDARGELLPPGVAGELHIGGAQVARGYLNRPELTAERFVADPFDTTPGARLYKTGDLARWRADGRIEFIGRNDHQVKIRGFRIEPGEIEARLLQCEGVAETLVVVREDRPGDKRLVAYVRADARTEALSVPSLRTELAAHLAEHMLPSAYVVLESFPLTPNGKVDRAALPAPRVSDDAATHVPPRSETEKRLCAIWADLLQVERIGVHDNFFEAGGHSLLLVQLHREIDAAWPRRLQIADYFKAPTVAALAARLDADVPVPEATPSGAVRAAARRQQQAAQQQQRARRTAR